MKILVVDDEKVLVKGLKFNLENEGYQVITGFDGAQAVELARQERPDLILLDVMMPRLDGLQACMQIRSFSDVPVIMLTAKSEDIDKIMGFECGVDDYVTKPFNVLELKARIKALLRRSKGDADQPDLLVGKILLDGRAHRVLSDGQEVALTNKEFELLRFLMKNAGKAFDREQLLQAVWGTDYFGGSRTVDVHIQTLRQKLGLPGNQIETIYGLGYKMGGNG